MIGAAELLLPASTTSTTNTPDNSGDDGDDHDDDDEDDGDFLLPFPHPSTFSDIDLGDTVTSLLHNNINNVGTINHNPARGPLGSAQLGR